MSYSETGRRRYTPAWQATRTVRALRRAADPAVQARAAEHARNAAQQRQKASAAAA